MKINLKINLKVILKTTFAYAFVVFLILNSSNQSKAFVIIGEDNNESGSSGSQAKYYDEDDEDGEEDEEEDEKEDAKKQQKYTVTSGAKYENYNQNILNQTKEPIQRNGQTYYEIKEPAEKPTGKIKPLGISVESFISDFAMNSNNLGIKYTITEKPKRKKTIDKDAYVFCMNKEKLCFTAIMEKNSEEVETIAMITAGDGTQKSSNNILKAVEAFIDTVTPGLDTKNRTAFINQLGIMTDSEIGNGIVTRANGLKIKYEYGKSPKTGFVMIASAYDEKLDSYLQ